jgi:hypothetical protein
MPNGFKAWQRSVEAQQWKGMTAIWTSLAEHRLPIIKYTHTPFHKIWSVYGSQHLVDRQAIKMWYEDTLSNVIHYIGGEDHGTD